MIRAAWHRFGKPVLIVWPIAAAGFVVAATPFWSWGTPAAILLYGIGFELIECFYFTPAEHLQRGYIALQRKLRRDGYRPHGHEIKPPV